MYKLQVLEIFGKMESKIDTKENENTGQFIKNQPSWLPFDRKESWD